MRTHPHTIQTTPNHHPNHPSSTMMRKLALVFASLALASAKKTTPAVAVTPVEDEDDHKMPKPMLKVLCQPTQMAKGSPIYLNLEYAAFFNRAMEIHVDLLNAETNEWIAGDAVKVTGSAGKVTTRLFVPADAPSPLKYNAYIAPQGEQWPNMIAQTSFEAPLGEKVESPCAPLRNSARSPKQPVDFDYVLVQGYPTGMKAGGPTEVTIQYNLRAGSEPTYVSAALLRNSDDSQVAAATIKAEEGEHTAKLTLEVPADAGTEPVHILATLKPIGKSFSERTAEDRVWSTAVYYRRNNLRA